MMLRPAKPTYKGQELPPAPRADPGVRLFRTGLLSKVRRIRGLGSSSGPWAQAVGDMPVPALCPGHALALALPSTLPSTLSVIGPSADVVRGFIGTMQPPHSAACGPQPKAAIPRWSGFDLES